MLDFIKKFLGQNTEADCCSVEIKEVEEHQTRIALCCESQSSEKCCN
ncbi:hypothetical protein [Neobacillus sp. YIM B06451]|nr:hypothetical protein [Neobacillus sp. YIM B06451]